MKLGLFGVGALAVMGTGAIGIAGRGDAQTAALSGETIFKQRCAACHSIKQGAGNRVGPNLSGIVGRRAASLSFNYSPALKKSNLVWSKTNLDRFLVAPTKMVPGTRMTVILSDAAQRAALVTYLQTAK